MSSHTRIRSRPRDPIVHTKVSGRTALSLERVLGSRGRTVLEETLQKSKMPQAQKWAPRQDGQGGFTTVVQGASLPGELVQRGMQRLELNIGLSAANAFVTHNATFSQTQPVMAKEVNAAIEKIVVANVNELLAAAVAAQLQQQLMNYSTQTLDVHVQQTNRQTTEILARIAQ